MVLQNGRTDGQIMALTLMGGDMQAQGHAQMMVNLVDLGANVQAATDMARFHHSQNNGAVTLESEAFKLVGTAELKAMGHNITSANGGPVGGYLRRSCLRPIPPCPNPAWRKTSSPPPPPGSRSIASTGPAPTTAKTAWSRAGKPELHFGTGGVKSAARFLLPISAVRNRRPGCWPGISRRWC